MIYKHFILSCILFFASFACLADEHEKYNPGEKIFEHLGDEYGWTTVLPADKDIFLPLPVIVRSETGKWHLFSSSKLRHGHVYHGFKIAEKGNFNGKIVEIQENGDWKRPWDLSVTKNVLAIFLATLFVMLSLFPLVRWYKSNPLAAPRRFRGFMEAIIEMVYLEGIKPILGKSAHKFAPYLLTVFFFILYSNLLGLMVVFPGGANVTGNISVTLVLALCTFLLVNLSGGKAYWKEIFWPDVPLLLKAPLPIMPLVELIGIFTKPIALMVRLFANMLSGHLITLIMISLIFILGSLGPLVMGGTTVISVLLTVFMNLIDVLISVIQAYVFMMLSTIFISMSIQHR